MSYNCRVFKCWKQWTESFKQLHSFGVVNPKIDFNFDSKIVFLFSVINSPLPHHKNFKLLDFEWSQDGITEWTLCLEDGI